VFNFIYSIQDFDLHLDYFQHVFIKLITQGFSTYYLFTPHLIVIKDKRLIFLSLGEVSTNLLCKVNYV